MSIEYSVVTVNRKFYFVAIRFCRKCYNFRPEVDDNDVISGVAVDYVGVNVHVQFGDSRSNGWAISRYSREGPISCRTNKHIKAYHIRHKRLTYVSPKNVRFTIINGHLLTP